MGRLRDSGLVTSTGGREGGWSVACAAEMITARDVFEALESENVFAIGASADHPHCPVEKAVNAKLSIALDNAQQKLLENPGGTTLEELARTVSKSDP